MNISRSVKIDCTKEKLWSWLTAFEKLKKWNKTILREEHLSSGEAKEGFLSKVLIREGKKEIWYNSEIMKYEAGKHLSIALSGGTLGKYPMTVDYDIIEVGHQSELTLNSHWKPSGFFLKLFYPLIKIKAAKNTEEVLFALKQQIEK